MVTPLDAKDILVRIGIIKDRGLIFGEDSSDLLASFLNIFCPLACWLEYRSHKCIYLEN